VISRRGCTPNGQILADESCHNTTLVLLLAYTGLRWREAVGLRVNSLDLARRRVLVQSNAVRVGGHIVIGSPKGYEMRSVPFPAFLGRRVREGRAAHAGARLSGDDPGYLCRPVRR
jgi:integrase